ncbi:putative gustatory receptor 28b [Megalopta genalis]|uniref:putative gustatory receptor 28b n=1 Tax=Megalopta genalis TaxID=115081 RepID=UPI003FD1C9AB
MAYPSRWTYRAILWCHIIFKIMGLSPISIHYEDSKTKRTLFFGRSKTGIFYNVFLTISLVALSFITLPRLYHRSYLNQSSLTCVVEMVQAAYGVLMVTTILLCYVFKWSIQKRICNYLVHAEGQFRFFREPISIYPTLRKLLIIYIVQTIVCISAVVTEEISFHNGPLGWALDFLPTAFAANILFQYFSVISLMTVNFVRANEAFESVCRSSIVDSKSLNRCRRVFVNCSMLQYLRHLRNIYDGLCEVTDEISQFYSFPTLIIVPFIFYSLIFNLYYLLQPLFDSDMDFELSNFINTATLIVYLMYDPGLLTAKITIILKEVGLHFCARNVGECFCWQGKFRLAFGKTLKQFSLQLLHRQIKFSANDYFNLDNSLFQSIISTVMAYLVILIQLETGYKSSHDCQCNCTIA